MNKKKKKIIKEEDEFFYKDRTYQLIKKEFNPHQIIAESPEFYVIAYKRDLCVKTQNNNNMMMPFEKSEDKTFCVLRVVSFEKPKLTKEIKDWLDLGCELSYITSEGFFVEETKI